MADAELRHRVLESAIQFVPIYGWSRQAVEAACQAEGLPSGLHSLAMPQGPIDLVLHFYASRNQRLAEAMSEWRLGEGASTQTRPTPNEVDAFLYRALKFRLEQIIPILDTWPQALGLLALPSNVPSSVGLLAQLVDEVWAQAGDRSTDMTWYAKRLGLAYVYNLTEVYMLQDKSPEFADSWVFLRTRLSDLRSLKQMNLKAVTSMVRDGVMAFGNVMYFVSPKHAYEIQLQSSPPFSKSGLILKLHSSCIRRFGIRSSRCCWRWDCAQCQGRAFTSRLDPG
ncbi:unnamed protein product [Echinostoma caproni]|uniref:Ubiquinone biosynthesis protein n=1 Tax=Echinostoma caproni TaxID=27848 RepID=A0A183B3M4_9TREM|nr:unnamed protein product [Echinostoma caproni]